MVHRNIITIINDHLPLPQATHEYQLVFAAITKIDTPLHPGLPMFFFELTHCKYILSLYYQTTHHSLVWSIISPHSIFQ